MTRENWTNLSVFVARFVEAGIIIVLADPKEIPESRMAYLKTPFDQNDPVKNQLSSKAFVRLVSRCETSRTYLRRVGAHSETAEAATESLNADFKVRVEGLQRWAEQMQDPLFTTLDILKSPESSSPTLPSPLPSTSNKLRRKSASPLKLVREQSPPLWGSVSERPLRVRNSNGLISLSDVEESP